MKRLLTLSLGLLVGCTGAQGYEFVRSAGAAKAQCDRQQTPAATASCEAHYRQSYDDYRQQRREVLEGEPAASPPSESDNPPP